MNDNIAKIEALNSERIERQKQRLAEFTEILANIKNLEDKKKMLWMHIYENAIEDRDNSFGLLSRLFATIESKPEEHAILGPIIAKYIERMSRANDQILKLAELIQRAETADAPINMDDIFTKIRE